MITRKDYIKIAKAVKDSTSEDYANIGDKNIVNKQSLIWNLCSVFEKDNPNFDWGRFRDACTEIGEQI